MGECGLVILSDPVQSIGGHELLYEQGHMGRVYHGVLGHLYGPL